MVKSFFLAHTVLAITGQSPDWLLLPMRVFTVTLRRALQSRRLPSPLCRTWGQGRGSSFTQTSKNGVMGETTKGVVLNFHSNSSHGQIVLKLTNVHQSQKVHQRERAGGKLHPRCQRIKLNYSHRNLHCQSPPRKIHKCLLCAYYAQSAVGAAINRFIGLLKANVPLGESDR